MTGRIAVFAGPSLPPHLRPDDERLVWFPPAATGDALALVGQAYDAICLIDGYFDHRPAPWHKELLAVMASGISLFGASSMGALRAAELDGYGMIGVGAIYHAYRSGLLTGDDEVALVHGPASIGWAAASVPMVEIRATLLRAVRTGLVEGDLARKLRIAAHAIHYVDRDWPLMAAEFQRQGMAGPKLAQQLTALHVPLKQHDAVRCLAKAVEKTVIENPAWQVPETCFLIDLLVELGLRQMPHRSV